MTDRRDVDPLSAFDDELDRELEAAERRHLEPFDVALAIGLGLIVLALAAGLGMLPR